MHGIAAFQFHTGSIKARRSSASACNSTWFDCKLACSSCGFNSTLVRLKPVMRPMVSASCFSPFQFHTGSIKAAGDNIRTPFLVLSFNSTLVRLKRAGVGEHALKEQHGFNSTLVRLKLVETKRKPVLLMGFQFHTGSIKAGQPVKSFQRLLFQFQFHTGSIKALSHPMPQQGYEWKFQFHTGSIKASCHRTANRA